MPPNRFSLRTACLTALWVLAIPATGSAQDEPADSTTPQADSGSDLHVFLMTIGQGDYIYEKFGHNAILIRNDAGTIDVAYNYGMFSFEQQGFVAKLLRGRMEYWMAGFDGARMIDGYISTNRSVWLQELNLRAGQKIELLRFLDWNAQPENRFYRYDYYRDNCSTRVRDALNRVMGGELENQLEDIETGETYRTHTQRLTAEQIPANTGLLLAMGHPADEQLTAWGEGFIPMELMAHVRNVTVPGPAGPEPLVLSETTLFEADRAPEWTEAPDRRVAYTTAGVLLGGLLMVLAWQGATKRAARAGFFALATAWALLAGIFGTMIALLWALTDHSDTFNNENLLQAGPLSLLLAGFLIAMAFGTARKKGLLLAIVVAILAGLGFVLQIIPGLDQPNGEIIGLAVPVHTALALSLGWLLKRRAESPAG